MVHICHPSPAPCVANVTQTYESFVSYSSVHAPDLALIIRTQRVHGGNLVCILVQDKKLQGRSGLGCISCILCELLRVSRAPFWVLKPWLRVPAKKKFSGSQPTSETTTTTKPNRPFGKPKRPFRNPKRPFQVPKRLFGVPLLRVPRESFWVGNDSFDDHSMHEFTESFSVFALFYFLTVW